MPKETTITDHKTLRGRKAMVSIGELKILARITDTKTAFGRVDVEIEPMHGEGKAWRQIKNIELVE